MKKWLFRGSVLFILLMAGFYSIRYLRFSLSHESTEDAYVAGMIVPIAAEIKGKVVKVNIAENQLVAEGMPLIEIAGEDYANALQAKSDAVSSLKAESLELAAAITQAEISLEKAKADLDAVISEEDLASKEKGRRDRLIELNIISQDEYDTAQSRLTVARAHKKAAEASSSSSAAALKTSKAKLATQAYKIKEAETSLHQAELDLQKTIIRAPISGRIAKKNVDPGKYVQVGQSLLAIVGEDMWVIANFKETQIERMTMGQKVELKVDAYPGAILQGRVDSIQPGTGEVFSLLPSENATGNFIKVVQRVPVKIVIDPELASVHPLWPGLSVVPSVDISQPAGVMLSRR